ncbi:FAD-dependent oxidoreductase [Amycolatopsis granulosa]|uniref:FAD-dependent oxidoreductase n=1 Tax=Amycolatopsis granulosa TaxID=185684 RepID=UPI00141F3BBC|nr:FAD-dependent oxidoreductase [Amycolatopsis granulosa]NIH83850.1 3-oxo-5alpha-steroid 4-dehydrogenase [Amycolatopsis granulosa]
MRTDPENAISPVSAASIGDWTDSADVVIAGYGIAGVCAAIEAARAGADVLILERTSGWGGAAALAGGFVYLGGGTPLQRALGFADTPENMTEFLLAAVGPGADEAKITDYCAGSLEHYDWLVGNGVPFREALWDEPGWEPPHDEGLAYSGGENAAPFHAIATPAPRGHVPRMQNKRSGERGGGYMLMKPLAETAEALGVRVRYDVRLTGLVVDGDRVAGVLAQRYGERVAIRADRGVVLATGGFAYAERMVADHAPQLIGRPGAAIEEHDGTGILLATALGAATAHMDATEVAFFCDPQLMARGILVNAQGQRYVPEDTYPGRIGQMTLFHQQDQAFLVMDERAYEEALATETATPALRIPPTWAADTVAELEADMRLPEWTLQSTVRIYNDYAAQHRDPLWGKRPRWLRPITGAVAGFDLRHRTAGFPLGGLRTDLDGRVLHVSGTAIPGLFAAGRCTSGICTGGYVSGASLGDGSFYGRRAGRAAAAN